MVRTSLVCKIFGCRTIRTHALTCPDFSDRGYARWLLHLHLPLTGHVERRSPISCTASLPPNQEAVRQQLRHPPFEGG
jgi:hypothetical protein